MEKSGPMIFRVPIQVGKILAYGIKRSRKQPSCFHENCNEKFFWGPKLWKSTRLFSNCCRQHRRIPQKHTARVFFSPKPGSRRPPTTALQGAPRRRAAQDGPAGQPRRAGPLEAGNGRWGRPVSKKVRPSRFFARPKTKTKRKAWPIL